MCGNSGANDTYCLDSCNGYEGQLAGVDDFEYRYYLVGPTSLIGGSVVAWHVLRASLEASLCLCAPQKPRWRFTLEMFNKNCRKHSSLKMPFSLLLATWFGGTPFFLSSNAKHFGKHRCSPAASTSFLPAPNVESGAKGRPCMRPSILYAAAAKRRLPRPWGLLSCHTASLLTRSFVTLGYCSVWPVLPASPSPRPIQQQSNYFAKYALNNVCATYPLAVSLHQTIFRPIFVSRLKTHTSLFLTASKNDWLPSLPWLPYYSVRPCRIFPLPPSLSPCLNWRQSCGFDEVYFPFTTNCYRGCCPDGMT